MSDGVALLMGRSLPVSPVMSSSLLGYFPRPANICQHVAFPRALVSFSWDGQSSYAREAGRAFHPESNANEEK